MDVSLLTALQTWMFTIQMINLKLGVQNIQFSVAAVQLHLRGMSFIHSVYNADMRAW